MNYLNEDILQIIFQYNNFQDYQNFYLVNSEWRYVIRRYTDYSRFLKYLSFLNFSQTTIPRFFMFLCMKNEHQMLKKLESSVKLDNKSLLDLFNYCCDNEKFELAEYIYSIAVFDNKDIINIFMSICYTKNIHIIRWYYILTEMKKRTDETFLFIINCECRRIRIYQKFKKLSEIENYCLICENDCLNGHIRMVEKLKKINNTIHIMEDIKDDNKKYYIEITSNRFYGYINIFTDINIYFSWLCMNGFLNDVINLYNNYKIDINLYNGLAIRECCIFGHVNILEYLNNNLTESVEWNFIEDAFYDACKNGRINVLEWFYENSLLDKFDNLDECFQICCQKNYLEMAKLLYRYVPNKIDIHYNNNSALHFFCKQFNAKAINWFHSLGADFTDGYYEPFRIACKSNNYFLLDFLKRINAINIYGKNGDIINICCYKNNINIIRWMFLLKNIDKIKLYEKIFNQCCKQNKFHILEWLYYFNMKKWIDMANNTLLEACLLDNVDLIKHFYLFGSNKLNDKLVYICIKNKSKQIIEWLNLNR